jgi:tetratricopeptide (TPR) repeat protein
VPGIGERLRKARLKAGLTQQSLAGDRYTKAYVSALENGLVNPSMVALEYLAGRLGTTASQLIADDHQGWSRLEADLLLASGQWQAAADAYAALLPEAVDPISRADIMRGAAEALSRLDRLEEAGEMAQQAIELYEAGGRETDAALASFWLAAVLHYQDEIEESREVLQRLLAKIRAGLQLDPDYKLRVLMAISTLEARAGNHDEALSYLEEVRGLADDLDYRRRAEYLFELARSHRRQGEFEAALHAGYASRALFSAARAESKLAALENDLALSHLNAGQAERAGELAASARQTFERMGDREMLAHALETQARIRAAEGDHAGAIDLATESLDLAHSTGNQRAVVSALLTIGRVRASLGQEDDAKRAFEEAAQVARRLGRRGVLRRALTEWADYLAGAGDHRGAFELTREALGA